MIPVRLCLAAVLIAAVACAPEKKAPVKAGGVSFADSADQVFHGVTAPFEVGGVKRGTLYADTMFVMNDQTRFDFIQGRVDFNTEYGKPDGTMRSDRGRYDRRTQILEGWGHVVVTSVDGRSLKSPHVVVNQLRDEIYSDTTFEVVDADGSRLTGVGFHTDSHVTKKKCDRDCKSVGKIVIPK